MFDALHGKKATSIKISKDLHDSTIIADILFIASYYGFLEESIDKLESCGQPLHANVKIVTDIMNIITSVNDTVANHIKEKPSTVINKNDGFKTLQNISSCLTRQPVAQDRKAKYTIYEILAFTFFPITSVDVEQSFSMYKNLFRSNRQNFFLKI